MRAGARSLMARSDAPLIRHLSEIHGPTTGRDWQRPPLVLLPGQGFVQYLIAHEPELSETVPELDYLPWDDVVFDYQDGRRVITDTVLAVLMGTEPPERESGTALLDRGTCWIRVRTLARYRQQLGVSAPWMQGTRDLLDPFASDPERWLAIEAWEQNALLPGSNERGFPAYPDVSLVPCERLWDFRAVAHLYPNPDCRSGRAFGDGHGFCNLTRCQFPAGHPVAMACHSSELIMSTGVRLALLTLAYLLQCDEHLVEVAPAAMPARRKGHQSGDKKPWTRALPHMIFLDPLRAHEYGQPPEAETQGTDKRASPRPHGRRGHWRILGADRFHRDEGGQPRRVFVRQAWIGPAVWESEGQQYRVLELWEKWPPRRGASRIC